MIKKSKKYFVQALHNSFKKRGDKIRNESLQYFLSNRDLLFEKRDFLFRERTI